jgi:hypothetical protein
MMAYFPFADSQEKIPGDNPHLIRLLLEDGMGGK